jgi:dihydropyrimidine dehydrogenase (NADP+)
MPERKMGMAMGQDCDLLGEVCGWINAKATKPVWAKMTPNITDITQPAAVAAEQGCEGIAAINTIRSVMGVNLDTLRPEPCVEGYSTPGGYSYRAVKPIALERVMSISTALQQRGFREQGVSLSGIGGVETGGDAAEFILLGADTVQVCTGVMVHGYPLVKHLCGGLQAFMSKHGFNSIEDFRGAALPYFTTHTDLVARQKAAIAERKATKVGLASDTAWTGDGFVQEAESMVSNQA